MGRLIMNIVLKVWFTFMVASVAGVLVFKIVPVWVTPLVVVRKVQAISNGEESKIYKNWKPYDEISKELALAVIASEDQNFPNHWGFDFKELKKVVTSDSEKKRGASTISQQVAKNVFLWNGRSYIRKGLEAWFTLLIELIWSKERILEVYLNVAEMGAMTFGAEAAAQRFFKKPAADLNRHEAARIAAVLPNPIRFKAEKPSSYIQKRTTQIVRQMRNLGGQKYLEKL